MNDKPIAPETIREWEEDPVYTNATQDMESIDDETAKMNPDAILVGLRFIHEYVRSSEGKAEARAAIEAGFFHVLVGPATDTNVYAIPRLIWRDEVYEKLYPGEGFSVSFGVQLGRLMLWGPPGLLKSRLRRKNSDRRTLLMIEHALRRFNQARSH